jgi:CheY-like chemotaxis protein
MSTHLEIALMSANGMLAKAASAGVEHFLEKPYTSESILKMLADVLHAG